MAEAKPKYADDVVTDLSAVTINDGNTDDVEKNLEGEYGILFLVECLYGDPCTEGLVVRVVGALESGGDYASDEAAMICFPMPHGVEITKYVHVPILLPEGCPQIKLILENDSGDPVTVTVTSRLIEHIEIV